MIDIIFGTVCILWAAYTVFGVFSSGGKADISWWIWPPIIMVVMPFLILKLIFNYEVAKISLIALNFGIVIFGMIISYAYRDKES